MTQRQPASDAYPSYFGPPGDESLQAYQQWVIETFGGSEISDQPRIFELVADYRIHAKSHYANKQEREHIDAALRYLVPYAEDVAETFGPRKLSRLASPRTA